MKIQKQLITTKWSMNLYLIFRLNTVRTILNPRLHFSYVYFRDLPKAFFVIILYSKQSKVQWKVTDTFHRICNWSFYRDELFIRHQVLRVNRIPGRIHILNFFHKWFPSISHTNQLTKSHIIVCIYIF